jgi:predicted Rdx family selenoprotein
MQPGKSGQFDVVIDGRVDYSRFSTGRFPAEKDLEALL